MTLLWHILDMHTWHAQVGATSMRPFAEEWEYGPDRFTWADQKQLEAQVLKDQLEGTSQAVA